MILWTENIEEYLLKNIKKIFKEFIFYKLILFKSRNMLLTIQAKFPFR